MQIVVNHWPCGWAMSITAREQEQAIIRLKTLRIIQEQVNSFTLSQNGLLQSFVLPKSFVQIYIDGLSLEASEWMPLRGLRECSKGSHQGSILFGNPTMFYYTTLSSTLEPRILALR